MCMMWCFPWYEAMVFLAMILFLSIKPYILMVSSPHTHLWIVHSCTLLPHFIHLINIPIYLLIPVGTDHHPNGCTRVGTEDNGAHHAGHNTSWLKAYHLDPAADRSDNYHKWHQKVKISMAHYGQDTLPDYKTTGGPSEQQTGYPKNG